MFAQIMVEQDGDLLTKLFHSKFLYCISEEDAHNTLSLLRHSMEQQYNVTNARI